MNTIGPLHTFLLPIMYIMYNQIKRAGGVVVDRSFELYALTRAYSHAQRLLHFEVDRSLNLVLSHSRQDAFSMRSGARLSTLWLCPILLCCSLNTVFNKDKDIHISKKDILGGVEKLARNQ
jgi:hypothetical protein